MKEEDIRPAKLLNRYLQLSKEDAQRRFDGIERTDQDCVACGSENVSHAFEKNGFAYGECRSCGTLFQTPRPPMQAFADFYRDSASNVFWAEQFFPVVAEARREKILGPRARSLIHICESLGIDVQTLVDVGAGHGILLEEWQKAKPGKELIAVEPSESMARECRRKGFRVVEEMAENVTEISGRADLVASFEVLEHVFDPLSFVKSLKRLAKEGGHVFVSTLCVDGFDIQTLWEKSNSVFPPHHLNFMSIEGFKRLFNRAGMEITDISTPGVLDVDIVRNFMKNDPGAFPNNRFLKKIVNDTELAKSFQEYLSSNLLSSHAWVFAKVTEIAR